MHTYIFPTGREITLSFRYARISVRIARFVSDISVLICSSVYVCYVCMYVCMYGWMYVYVQDAFYTDQRELWRTHSH